MLGRIYVTKIDVTKHIATLQNDNNRLKKKIESLEKTVADLKEKIVSEDDIRYIINMNVRQIAEILERRIDEAKEDCEFSDKQLKESIPGIVRSEIAESDIQDQVLLKVVKAGLRIDDQE